MICLRPLVKPPLAPTPGLLVIVLVLLIVIAK